MCIFIKLHSYLVVSFSPIVFMLSWVQFEDNFSQGEDIVIYTKWESWKEKENMEFGFL